VSLSNSGSAVGTKLQARVAVEGVLSSARRRSLSLLGEARGFREAGDKIVLGQPVVGSVELGRGAQSRFAHRKVPGRHEPSLRHLERATGVRGGSRVRDEQRDGCLFPAGGERPFSARRVGSSQPLAAPATAQARTI